MKTNFKLLVAMVFCMNAFNSTGQEVDVEITADTYQTVEGIGGATAYYQNWLTAHPNKTAIYDTLFEGLGLSGLRMANWAQEADADLSNDVEIYEEAKKRLGDSFFVTMSSWSAPAELKANNSLNGSNGGVKASLKKENGVYVYDQFGAWWRTALEKYHAVGLVPDYISIQNEPDMDAQYEATLFNPTENEEIASYGKALAAVAEAIKGMPDEPKLLGPEPLGIGWNATQNYVKELDKNLLYGYAFHYYHSGDQTHDADKYSYPDDFIPAMDGLGKDLADKPMFMTENCSMREHRKEDAVYLAWMMANSFNVNRVSSYLFWDLIWGADGGCIQLENPWQEFTSPGGFRVMAEYHALRHYTKFVKKGWLCMGVSSSSADVVAAAFRSPQSDAYTVVLVNKGSSAHDVSLALPADAGAAGDLIQSVVSADTWSEPAGSYTEGMPVALPAMSVTTVVVKNDMGNPAVSILEPGKNEVFIQAETVQINASASDSNGSIAKVACYVDDELILEKTAAPYTFEWIAETAGVHKIKIVVTDDEGYEAEAVRSLWVNLPQGPYNGIPHAIPGTIQFEEFDVGGNGYAYFDEDAGSNAVPKPDFRSDEDVDIENCQDVDGGYNLGYTMNGEWLEYTVSVETAGVYELTLRVACLGAGRSVSLLSDGESIASDITIPDTEGWQEWIDVKVSDVQMESGEQVLRLIIDGADYINLNYIVFEQKTVQKRSLPLKQGWNLVGYPLDDDREVADALSSILDYLQVVKDFDGFWDVGNEPAYNSLNKLSWGKGYFVKVSQNCELEW